MKHDIKEDVMIMLYTIKVILGILLFKVPLEIVAFRIEAIEEMEKDNV